MKHRPDFSTEMRNFGLPEFADISTLHENLPLIRLLLTNQHAQQRRFPRTAWSHEQHEFTLLDIEGHIGQRRPAVVPF